MTEKLVQLYEVEGAIERSPKKSESGRYAVYVPGVAVVGTYDEPDKAQNIASAWKANVPEVVVIDRDDIPLGVHTPNRARL